MTFDPSLLDHLLSIIPEQDAIDVNLWAQHPWAVRLLLCNRGTWASDYGGGGCGDCHVSWGDDNDAQVHERDCKWVEALVVLKHPLAYNVLAEMAEAAWAMMHPPTDHFADATTQELRQEEQYMDENGVVRIPYGFYDDY